MSMPQTIAYLSNISRRGMFNDRRFIHQLSLDLTAYRLPWKSCWRLFRWSDGKVSAFVYPTLNSLLRDHTNGEIEFKEPSACKTIP